MRSLLWLIPVAMLSCGSPSSSSETAAADSTSVESPVVEVERSSTKDYTFYNEAFLQKPLATNLGDTVLLAKLFKDYPDAFTVYYYEDRTVWYVHINTLGPLSMECFYFPDVKRLFVDYVSTNHKALTFANDVRVGMSRPDFISRFQLDTARARISDRFVINSDSTLNEATFEFDGETLAKVTLTYQHDNSDPIPPTLYDVADMWTSVVINEGEGQKEMFVACDYSQYRLGTDGGPRMNRINTLTLEKGDESKTDSVTSIVRSSDGLIIRTLDASNSWKPGIMRVNFLEDDWSVANWNQWPFAVSAVADILTEEPCGDDGG